jgi:hypothetical protein
MSLQQHHETVQARINIRSTPMGSQPRLLRPLSPFLVDLTSPYVPLATARTPALKWCLWGAGEKLIKKRGRGAVAVLV